MVNISSEHKINFSFYCNWILLGAVIGLFCLFVSVAFSKPFFLFLAVVFFGAGILIAILFYRGENKKPGHKQTNYMKDLARRWKGKEPEPKQGTRDKAIEKELAETKEEIPPVEILPEEEEKKVEVDEGLEE